MWVVGEFLASGWYKSHGRHATRHDAERVGTEIAEALGVCPPLVDGKAHCPDCSSIINSGIPETEGLTAHQEGTQ